MNTEEQKKYIFGGLFVLSNRVQILGDKIDPDMTIKQWLFLAMMSRCISDNPTISELASVIGSSHQNVKKMGLILEKRGFVRLFKDKNDARVTRVEVTDRCQEYFIQNNSRGITFMEKLLADFSEDEIRDFYQGMKKMEENVIRMEQEDEASKEER
jgi:DNA-binding MarR family transcriptional regulator